MSGAFRLKSDRNAQAGIILNNIPVGCSLPVRREDGGSN